MKRPLRVLIVEDNPDDADLSLAEVRRVGFDPQWTRVETEADFLTALKELPEIILSDYSMPRFSGLEAVRLLRGSGLDIPFILISGTVGEDAAVEAMQLGATDYLLKDRLVRLGSAVERALTEAHHRSERKKAEMEISIQSRALEASANAILITDRKGQILSANSAFCALTGYSLEEVLGRNPRFLKSGAHDDAFYKSLWDTVSAGDIWRGELTNRRKDGSLFPEEMTITPVRADTGEITHFIAVKQDATERKRTEARFRRLVNSNAQGVYFWNAKCEITCANDAFLRIVGHTRAELEAGQLSVAALTPREYADLDRRAIEEIAAKGVCTPFEKEYRRSDGSHVSVLLGAAAFEDNPEEGVCFVLDLTERKKLEQQFLRAQRLESIGTLAGGIAHDLNNVFGPIIMSIDLLKMKFTDTASQEFIDIIGSSALRGADMVRQVLSFARGVEGRRMIVQVKHVLQDMEKIANETFFKHIHVRTILPGDLWTVQGDPTQIHQVLLNLCVNARDAMPSGGTLTLSAENRTLDAHYAGTSFEVRPGPYVFLQVEDSGTGIPPALVEKIFDPFFTTKEIGKGTGLGLSTSLAIVKSHGGFIQVYSEPGKGTKFKVYLPAQTGVPADAAVEHAAEMPRGDGQIILVVDDEASVRQITQQTLEAFGYRVLLACDGAEALAIHAHRYKEIAVVLTDMMMPVMDGPATIQVLRRIDPAARIIAASGLSASSHVAHAARLGVKHFLPKPYSAETLLKTIKQILRDE